MDHQYGFATRDDIWRVFEELKELHSTQFEHSERLARLERRRDEDARLRNVWGPLSPFPNPVGSALHTGKSCLLDCVRAGIRSILCCELILPRLGRTLTSLLDRRIQRFRAKFASVDGDHDGVGWR